MASEHQIPEKDIDWDELRAAWGIAEPSSDLSTALDDKPLLSIRTLCAGSRDT